MVDSARGSGDEVVSSVDGARSAESDRPTWRPSEVRKRALVDVPLDELLYRFAMGDREGAVHAAETVLAASQVPAIRDPRRAAGDGDLDACARWLIPFVVGVTPLDRVRAESGLPLPVALQAFCELLERKIVVLR